MLSLEAMRRRLPLWAFILLAVLCLVLLGIACACATGHPAQKVDHAFGGIAMGVPVVEVWTLALGGLILFVALDVRRRRGENAPSPAVLQRFLF